MAPDLMNIPPELQSLTGDHLHVSDLNSVSRTCKTMKNAFLAKLYSRVVIKVPIRWSRLVSLEKLLSSAGDGLKFTTDICITAQQQPSKNDTLESEDSRTTQEIVDEENLLFCLPQMAASKALNGMIRLLLMRIPDNHLKVFNWRHSCVLETSTLAILLKHHGATLRGLGVTRYSEPQNVSSLLVGGLQDLVITDLNIEQKCEWPSRLIALNRNTLRHLNLGIMSTIAQNYVIPNHLSQHGLATSFAEMAKEALPASEREMMPTLSLETLGLYGLNFENVVGKALGLEIDFNSMTALRLESCSGLNEAFALLMGNDGSQNATLSTLKLTSFFVRHEDRGQAFVQHFLTAFLTSFAGLKHLGVLLDGQIQAMRKAPILEIHGKTLQTLVWEERSRPRKDTKTDTSLFLKDNTLSLVSVKCPNLTALGLPLRWDEITKSNKYHLKLWKQFRKMSKLRTLNLRNLPKTDLNTSCLPTDYLIKGLANVILDALTYGHSSNRRESLTTIALGAPVYRDIHIGSNHFPSDPVRNFLQLRVYHVDYGYQSVLGPSPTVTQVAKGTAYDATTCFDKDILHAYWLA